MTLYECLGIENDLTDKEIPLDEIIENINDEELQYKALCYFEGAPGITQRAFFNRNRHCLQVIEVELNRVDYIDKISELIQKAIRCKVLIVFIYEGRYVVATSRMRQNWIYGENLEDELVAEFVFNEITIDDENFNDVIGNAKILNQDVRESDYICLRQLCDWIKSCNSEDRVEVYNVLEKVREKQAYRIINDIVFVEKEAICDMVKGLDHSYNVEGNENTMSITHEEVEEYKNYLAREDWVIREKDAYNRDEISSEIPKEIVEDYILTGKACKDHIEYIKIQNTHRPRPTMNERVWNWKPKVTVPQEQEDIAQEQPTQPERHWVEEQDLTDITIFKLKLNGIRSIEELQGHDLNNFQLNNEQQVKLIKIMDIYGVRPHGAEIEKYPDIMEYVNEKYSVNSKCRDCGKDLNIKCMPWEYFLCPKCYLRRREKEGKWWATFSCKSFNFEIQKNRTHTLNMTWELSGAPNDELKNYKLIKACVTFRCGCSAGCLFKEVHLKARKKMYLTCNSRGEKLYKENVDSIRLIYENIDTNIFYLLIGSLHENCFGERYEIDDCIDYLDYDAYREGKIRQLKQQMPPSLRQELSLVENNQPVQI